MKDACESLRETECEVGLVVPGCYQARKIRLSERELSGSILSDLHVCFDFPVIRVAIALNIHKTEHWQRGNGRTVGFH